MSARGLGSIAPMAMPMQMPMPGQGSAFGLGLGFQELMRPSSLKLPLGEVGGGGDGGGMVGGERRPLFPFEDLKQVPMRNGSHESDLAVVQAQGDTTLFWNDVMGNGSVRGGGGGGGGGGTW
ncbi:hypothetical protein HPP92_012577 [Vanilla planifolia]|uniref:Uncharacterized protein n=1 Tax=Vanilla planifolia TaxID=51239 RepID=A0A835R0P9_VANPL|nr:hypothetical protein HPP92_012577 [Vanilla planifolia]